MRRLRDLFHSSDARSGAAGVEFALAVPILLLLLGGFMEIGRMLVHRHTLETGMRAAGRYLARFDLPARPEGELECASAPGTPANLARNIVLYGTPKPTRDTPPLIAYLTDPAAVCFEGPFDAVVLDKDGYPVPGVRKLRVSVSAPYQDIGLLNVAKIAPVTLTARHEEVWIDE